MIALKCVSFGKKSGAVEKWVDGESYNASGAIVVDALGIRLDNWVEVIGGHTISVVGLRGYLLEYAVEGGQRLDCWSVNSSRSISLKAQTNLIRFSVSDKSVATVYDSTDGRYILKDGKIA